MGHLFIGHGGLDISGHSYNEGMGIVAVPPGTTLQFYTDAGQALRLGNVETAFSQLQAPWPTLTSESVTYNFSLAGIPITMAQERWDAVQAHTGHTPHIPGWDLDDPIQLCTGTTDTCPTSPWENRQHACNGILARFTGELHWIACTSFDLPVGDETPAQYHLTEDQVNEAADVLDVALQNRPISVYLNADPDSVTEHTANLVANLKPMFLHYQALGRIADFQDLFNSDSFTDDERATVRAADPEIAEACPEH
jgi:hypothetical protein